MSEPGLTWDAAWRAEILEVGNSHIAFLGGASTLGPGSAATKDRPGVAPIHVSEAYSVDPAAAWSSLAARLTSLREPGKKTWTAQQKPSPQIRGKGGSRCGGNALGCATVLAVPLSGWISGLSDRGRSWLDRRRRRCLIGHHPHSLQEVEVYKGRPILYSLGNFAFHHSKGPVSDTPISRNAPYGMSADLRRNRNWSETVIVFAVVNQDGDVTYTLQPALLDDDGNPSLLHGDEARTVVERLDTMSPNADIQFRDGIGHLSLS